jgi:hypothetical protein
VKKLPSHSCGGFGSAFRCPDKSRSLIGLGMLQANGFQLVKLFLNISKDTQRKRLHRRAERPDKRWKLTVADLDSHALWDAYDQAVHRMIDCCAVAPWVMIDANDKKAGRVAALQAVLSVIQAHEKPRTFALNPGVAERLSELAD